MENEEKEYLETDYYVNDPQEIRKKNVIYVSAKPSTNKYADADTKANVLMNFLLKNGIIIDEIYKDACNIFDLSEYARPSLFRLIKASKDGKIDSVYVYDENSFSPNAAQLLKYIFYINGTKLIYATKTSILTDTEALSQFGEFQSSIIKKLNKNKMERKNGK